MSNKHKSIKFAVLSSVLAGSLAAGSIAAAFGETEPEGVSIRSFSLLDTASDVVGAADFTPEGNKDGHFKLELQLKQKTVIKSVVLRSTDSYGKDNSQGVWRTNRVTTGWLLGIKQDQNVVNPGFSKDLNTPVGEFQGNLTFDLYASNNGTIKETQYYVLEIETPQGTIVSKPIKYKSPWTAEGSTEPSGTAGTPSPAPSPTPTPSPTPSPTPEPTPSPQPAQEPQPSPSPSPSNGSNGSSGSGTNTGSNGPVATTDPKPAPGGNTQSNIHVLFKGNEIAFSGGKPIIKNGTTLVPFRKIFETLGFTVKWVGAKQQAIGTKEGLTIELTINSNTAKVNGQNVALDTPAQIVNGNTLIPLRFLAENSGYGVSFSSSGGITTIKIEEGSGTANPGSSNSGNSNSGNSNAGNSNSGNSNSGTTNPANDIAEPYVVKGYVRTKDGKPVPGAEVFADNTQYYDSNTIGVTDANGFYRIELPREGATYNMTADVTATFNGQTFTFHLESNPNKAFSGKDGAVRNFTMKGLTGQIFVYSWVTWELGRPDFKIEDLELTLTPIGKLMDGSDGETIVKKIGPVDGGLGIGDIPLGKYKATARWLPEGHDPYEMEIRLNFVGTWGESAEFEFNKPRTTVTSNYLAELEVRLPETEESSS